MTKAYVLINCEVVYTNDVLDKLRAITGLTEAHVALGPYDIVAEIVADSMETILLILQTEIRAISGIRNTVTCITTN